MYSKQHVSQMRQEFWTTFGQYMSPVASSEGEKINWVNYKTGQKHVYFIMEADQQFASVGIEITHPALDEQKLYFDHFKKLKPILEATVGEKWDWVLHAADETGKVKSRIFYEIADKNIFDRTDWPALISFFKPRLIALDEFWNNVKYGFEAMEVNKPN